MVSERRTITVDYPTGRTYKWNGWGEIALMVEGKNVRTMFANQRTLGGAAGALAVIESWESRVRRGGVR
jgi:hypothetical protein